MYSALHYWQPQKKYSIGMKTMSNRKIEMIQIHRNKLFVIQGC